jgi:hypothetical protein
MINLLPPEYKETYRYGRLNRKLAHWIAICVLCLCGGLVITDGGYLYLSRSITTTYQQINEGNKQLHTENQAAVQKQVTTISNNLKLAVQVLSKEVLFSDLIKQIAAVTPNNTILTNLTIIQAQGGIDITANTTDYNAATQLQVNLADPKNKLFSQADIESISCNSGNGSTQYPCSVSIRALFAKNNPFLFINSKGSNS